MNIAKDLMFLFSIKIVYSFRVLWNCFVPSRWFLNYFSFISKSVSYLVFDLNSLKLF